MNTPKPIKTDGGGFEALKPAVLSLVNNYPALNGRVITFQGLSEDSGISIEPESGALVYFERTDLLGNVRQICQFPFFVVYRSGASSEYQKLGITEFLDNLGAWLCREPIIINQHLYQLTEYPSLADGRQITKVDRFNSYAIAPNENNTQDWLIPITVHYTHEFKKG